MGFIRQKLQTLGRRFVGALRPQAEVRGLPAAVTAPPAKLKAYRLGQLGNHDLPPISDMSTRAIRVAVDLSRDPWPVVTRIAPGETYVSHGQSVLRIVERSPSLAFVLQDAYPMRAIGAADVPQAVLNAIVLSCHPHSYETTNTVRITGEALGSRRVGDETLYHFSYVETPLNQRTGAELGKFSVVHTIRANGGLVDQTRLPISPTGA